MKKILFSAVAAGLLVLACNPEEQQIVDPQISVDPTFVEAAYTDTICDVSVVSNTAWVLSRMDDKGKEIDWVRVTALSGKGSKQMQIKVLANPDTVSRAAVLTFKAGTALAYLDVSQAANPNPPEEPEPDGYGFPMVQRFTTGLGPDIKETSLTAYDFDTRPIVGAKIKNGKVVFGDGLEIEAVNDDSSPVTYKTVQPAHTNPTSFAGFQEGIRLDGFTTGKITYSILFNVEVSGKVRFFKGQRRESSDSYEWSSDNGSTWNTVGAATSGASDASWKYLDFEIPASDAVAMGHRLLIRESVTYNASATYQGIIMGVGIALTAQEGALSSVPATDDEVVIFSEGFDDIKSAPAAFLLDYGFMKSWTSGKHNTPSYVPASGFVTATECFSRPGFLQVGFADEALAFGAADVYKPGSYEIAVGERMKQMGLDSAKLEISFLAAGLTTAFEEPCNAAPVVVSSNGTVSGSCGLVMDEWNDYTFTVDGADTTTVIRIESNSTAKGARSGKTDSRFFIDDVVVKVAGESPRPDTLALAFDFTGTPQKGWPVEDSYTHKDGGTEAFYTIGTSSYSFILADCDGASKCRVFWSTAESKRWLAFNAKHRYLGLPPVEGYKLVKVEFTHGTSGTRGAGICHQIEGTNVVPSGEGGHGYVGGGENQSIEEGAKATYVLSDTKSGTRYFIYVSSQGIGIPVLNLTYAKVKK